MDFRDPQPIYLQIAEYAFEQILIKNWAQGEKIPSIRDMAVVMEVNPNTVQRSYDFLQQHNIIINKRGVGYFVAENAVALIKTFKKEQFVVADLPVFFKSLYLLDISFAELENLYKEFVKQNFKEDKL